MIYIKNSKDRSGYNFIPKLDTGAAGRGSLTYNGLSALILSELSLRLKYDVLVGNPSVIGPACGHPFKY